MNKDDILSRSRSENKDRDLYALEVDAHAGSVSAFAALALATVFFVAQQISGHGWNFGLYAIVFSVGAARFVYLAIRMKRRRDVVLAVIYALATLALSAIHMVQLLSATI